MKKMLNIVLTTTVIWRSLIFFSFLDEGNAFFSNALFYSITYMLFIGILLIICILPKSLSETHKILLFWWYCWLILTLRSFTVVLILTAQGSHQLMFQALYAWWRNQTRFLFCCCSSLFVLQVSSPL